MTMRGIYFEKLDAKWHGFAKIALTGVPVERHAVCHAAFLVGAAAICNILPLQEDDATAAALEEFFGDVEAACGEEAAMMRRARTAPPEPARQPAQESSQESTQESSQQPTQELTGAQVSEQDSEQVNEQELAHERTPSAHEPAEDPTHEPAKGRARRRKKGHSGNGL
jgi:hypothetical protein